MIAALYPTCTRVFTEQGKTLLVSS